MGKYHNANMSKRLIEPFIKAYQIPMDDFVVPEDGYKTFNDFFARALKPYARTLPLDKNRPISPADAKLFVIPRLTPSTIFFAKQLPFCLKTFFDNATLSQIFNNGTLCLFRLAPYDYHRFHAPVSGIIEKIYRIKGLLESVNPLAFMTSHQPLTENERIIIIIKSPVHSHVAIAAIGAMFVGSISITISQGSTVTAGDELGYFAFGGSSVAVIFSAGCITLQEHFLAHSLQGHETAISMGEAFTE
jgi:phosphatidylserine decarboxylase